jgi:hypothetical protein
MPARIAIELVEALPYKMCMFGIPIDGPENVYCNTSGVVTIALQPKSTLKTNIMQ